MIKDFTKEAIQLEERPFDDTFSWSESHFRGDPRPELDDAWKSLIHGKLLPLLLPELLQVYLVILTKLRLQSASSSISLGARSYAEPYACGADGRFWGSLCCVSRASQFTLPGKYP